MILSMNTENLPVKLGSAANAVSAIANAGFDAFDFSMFGGDFCEHYLIRSKDERKAYLDEIKSASEQNGIICNQVHAPFPSSMPDEPQHKAFNERIFDDITASIEAAAYLGARQIIVHPVQHLTYNGNEKLLFDMNMDFYRSLAPYAKKAGIRICLENMFQWDGVRQFVVPSTCGDPAEFVRYLETLDDDVFTGCLDLGHFPLCRFKSEDAIRTLGKYCGALHVHDNDFRADNHTIPYLGRNGWDAICSALHDIDYKGEFTFEVMSTDTMPNELIPAALEFLCKIGRYLTEKTEL